MSKHTPGPWPFRVGDGRIRDNEGYRTIAIVVPDETKGNHRGHIEDVLSKQALADLRLIAAAPDLLAACEALVERHECDRDCDAENIVCVKRLGRAAIAKARGSR